MRTYLLIAALWFGCMVPLLAKADEPGPTLPNPSVNIQQPPLARPIPPPRPRVSRPDPPVKTAAVKKSSRSERRKSKRRAEKSKPRQVVEAKAKPSPRRPSPAKTEKVVPKDATASVEASPEHKRPSSDHPLRRPAAATSAKDTEVAPRRAPGPDPVIDLRKPDLDQPDRPGVAPEQQTATQASEPKHGNTAPETAPSEQTAAVSRTTTTESQEERTIWWARQGSPAVARFRDCSAAYAARNIGKDAKATWADLLIRAAEGDCRVVFNDMAGVLTARLGNDAQSVIRSLIETTFLPAARKAAASTQRVAGGKSDPAPAAPVPPQ